MINKEFLKKVEEHDQYYAEFYRLKTDLQTLDAMHDQAKVKNVTGVEFEYGDIFTPPGRLEKKIAEVIRFEIEKEIMKIIDELKPYVK